MLLFVSWTAVIILSLSYWFQIFKIHRHKEVRDISLVYHIFLALGFGILIWTAVEEDSTLFLVKQITTFIPVVIIILQVIFHRKERWHDDNDPFCKKCNNELELNWKYCPFCGTK